MDNMTIIEKWKEAIKIVADSGADLQAEWLLKGTESLVYKKEENLLRVYLNLYRSLMLGDDCKHCINNAVNHVFGEKTEVFLIEKGEMTEADAVKAISFDKPEKKERPKRPAVPEPDRKYHSYFDMRKYEEMNRIREMIRNKPEVFFSGNVPEELFFRVLTNFINCSEFIRYSKNIKVTKKNKCISVQDVGGFSFHLRMLATEMKLFEKADYYSYTVPPYRRLSRYNPIPFYFTSDSSLKFTNRFYINTSLYLTMFMLISLSDFVVFENVLDNDIAEIFTYKDGKSLSDYEEKIESDKDPGSHITYSSDGLTSEAICRVLERASLLANDLTFTFVDFDEYKTFVYGCKDTGEFLAKQREFEKKCACGTFDALGQDRYDGLHYNAKLSLALNLSKIDPFVNTYYNYSLLEEDNVFAKKLYEVMAEKLNAFINEKTDSRLDVSDVKKIASFVLDIRTDDDCTKWAPERTGVKSKRMLEELIEDAADKLLGEWLELHKDDAMKIVTCILSDRAETEYQELFPDGMK